MNEYISYKTTLKACGKEYMKIVFWNRFIRNPIELILTLIPAAASVVAMSLGYFTAFTAVIYAACWAYPLYIFLFQFKSSVNYHLKHRDPAESAPCTISVSEVGINAEIPSFNQNFTYEWDEFTTIYNKLGYYMFFNDKKMIVMLRKADMSEKQLSDLTAIINKYVNMNKCKVLI